MWGAGGYKSCAHSNTSCFWSVYIVKFSRQRLVTHCFWSVYIVKFSRQRLVTYCFRSVSLYYYSSFLHYKINHLFQKKILQSNMHGYRCQLLDV